VVIPLLKRLEDQSRALQQICSDFGANDIRFLVEHDLNVFAETRRIVVTGRLCVTKGFHDGIGGQDLLFCFAHRVGSTSGTYTWLIRGFTSCKISHNVLGADSLASTGLTRHDDGLVLAVVDHFPSDELAVLQHYSIGQAVGLRKGLLCYSKQMRCLSLAVLARIYLDHTGNIERVDSCEGIGGNQDDAAICVYFLLRITQFDCL